MRWSMLGAWIAGTATVLASIIPAFSGVDEPVAIHHLDHSGLILGGVVTASLAYSVSAQDGSNATGAWLASAILAPIAIMLLMWPSMYEYLDARPWLHAAEHVSLAGLGFVAAYSGQRYARGVGVAIGILTIAMAAVSAGGYGIVAP